MEIVGSAALVVHEDAAPGQIFVDGQRIVVCCARDTWVELVELQLEGKKRMTASEFLRGTQLVSGMRLG
jgi:methionyl-tRNA formyltransferase